MKNIAVIGTGYVGLTTGTCFADMGNQVTCLDIDEEKILRLRQGIMPIHEPGLQEVVIRNLGAGRLHFTTSYREALQDAEFVFIAVGTPDNGRGGADLSQVRAAAQSIASHLDHPIVVVNKSTVPIGTGDLVTSIINEHRRSDIPFAVVSNPEFLREGSAMQDCMNPDRVVLGATDRDAADKVAALYLPLRSRIIITDLRTAEMIKYASNAFLATKISFINEIAGICARLGADVTQVAQGMGYDARIGPAFLDAGLGFGGSCFPKDVKALMSMAADAELHPQLLDAVMEINASRRRWVVETLKQRLGALAGRQISLLGLAFKPDTDDVREAPALEIIELLRAEGATVVAYDPAAMTTAAAVTTQDVRFAPDAYEAVTGSDAVVLVTQWNEFKNLDLTRVRSLLRRPLLIDGRNLYAPEQLADLGFEYVGVARGVPATEGQIEPQVILD
ncbi:MAG TPA: UDP-glucose/GDP-mannose dehydrogenase family protein [Chloroflexota bacterium]|nr:UDP-glucose/GDP-mannose dehydrogenase family protein [Chloroflexota bacterium]